jgi:hypothetical protein
MNQLETYFQVRPFCQSNCHKSCHVHWCDLRIGTCPLCQGLGLSYVMSVDMIYEGIMSAWRDYRIE